MNKRWLVAGAAVAVGGAYFLFHSSGHVDAMTTAQRDGKVAVEIHRNVDVPAAPVADPLAPHPGKKFVKPKPVFNPKNGSYEMPMIDAVPDPEGEALEQFTYKVGRMRLAVSDEAAHCYTGPDGREKLSIKYSMVVDHEVIRADNVQLVESEFSDPAAVQCIMSSIRDMRQLEEGMPDLKQDFDYQITAHELYVRNRQDNGGGRHSSDNMTPGVDQPTIVPTPLPAGASNMPKPHAGDL